MKVLIQASANSLLFLNK